MALDLTESLQRYREVAAQFENSTDSVPRSLQPLVNLIQTQTSLIEALIAAKSADIANKHKSQTSQYSADPGLAHDGGSRATRSEPQKWQIIEKTTKTIYGPRPVVGPRGQSLSKTTQSKYYTTDHLGREISPIDEELVQRFRNKQAPLNSEMSSEAIGLMRMSMAAGSSSQALRMRSHVTSSGTGANLAPLRSRASPSPSQTSWLRDSSPRASISEPVLPPPTRPVSYTPIRSQSSSSNSSVHSISTCRLCQQCESGGQKQRGETSAQGVDPTYESYVQEATRKLISAMKDRKKVPVGSLKGMFKLYSSEYRSRYCIHSEENQQKVSVFTDSIGWAEVRPVVASGTRGQISMELFVYPECHIIVRPFQPPQYAGWKWFPVEAIGVKDGVKKRVEVMFLGDGFVRLKLRLSYLLGSQMTRNDPDRFVEFSGLWENPRESTYRLSTAIIEPVTEEPIELDHDDHVVEEPKSTRKADSGFYSRGPSRNDDMLPTPMTATESDVDKKLTQIWSPVSPMEWRD